MAWQIDPAHTEITFKVRHMMITNVTGNFTKFSGTVEFNPDSLHLSKIDVTIDASSINTREEKRDGHLKSPDFFDVATYPTITFKSTKVDVNGARNGKVTGDLTLHGVTKPVVLDVEHIGISKSPFGSTNAGFTATTKINRKDWDLGWNVALEAGGWLVGEDITINIEAELIQIAETEKATA